MATTAKNNSLTNQEQYELTQLQMERAAGGKRPKPTDGIHKVPIRLGSTL